MENFNAYAILVELAINAELKTKTVLQNIKCRSRQANAKKLTFTSHRQILKFLSQMLNTPSSQRLFQSSQLKNHGQIQLKAARFS
jgi:hypothetical protein